MQVVAYSDAHVGLRGPVGAERDAGRKSNVGEFAVTVALVQVTGLAVVADQKIELAVVVEVAPDCSQAIAMFGVTDAGTFRDVGEGSVMVVVVEVVGRALEAARSALNVDAHVSACVARSEGVEVIQVDIDIVRDEKSSQPSLS